MNDNKTFTSRLAQNLGSAHFVIGNKRWHINELLCLQHMLLVNAPSLKEGILWWSKSVSLFDKTLYIETESCSGFLSLTFHTHDNAALPSFSYSAAQNLLTQLELFTEFHHSWLQTKTHNLPQLRNEFAAGLKIHFDLQEINAAAAPEPNLFALAKQVLVLLQNQSIEKDLFSKCEQIWFRCGCNINFLQIKVDL